MHFDQSTRNRLDRFVSDARDLLTKEFARQLQQVYGMDPVSGTVSPIDSLQDLDDSQFETARILRDTLDYYQSENPDKKGSKLQVLNRILREQSFTVLNRLCALRLAETRGLILETIANGYQSEGFQLYKTLAGAALGETMDAYRTFLFSIFDELAVELPPLFDRFSPEGRLFPGQTNLQELLALINDPELASLWSEDETIGWIYQYFNSQEERREMRAASQIPRNSRELAVRNQFFTPRYVVEFLTDNTLGRIWYEMTRGETSLTESCEYLVRRKHTFFLKEGEDAPEAFDPKETPWGDQDFPQEMWVPPNPDLDEIEAIFQYALTVDGYQYAKEHLGIDCGDLANKKLKKYHDNGSWEGTFEELRCCLFFEQRRYRHYGWLPESEDLEAIQDLYQSICERWDYEVEYVHYRQLKDPREIKMLDPACGSMHFGLYAFDLFEQIYTEAWDIETEIGADALWRSTGQDPLHEVYPDKNALMLDVPRLIIERNIHGIDIDPRAVQIAGLSLWLRANKSWVHMGIPVAKQPQIRKSNIVCAEPMPGNLTMLNDFLITLDEENLKRRFSEVLPFSMAQSIRVTEEMVIVFKALVREIWGSMELAGDAGSLLRITEILHDIVAEARRKSGEDLPLLQALNFNLSETSLFSEHDFWHYADTLVVSALKDYSTIALINQNFQRRLFINDSLSGFAFIDISKKTFDIILMNPPFGKPSKLSKEYLSFKYSLHNDIAANFITRGLSLMKSDGLLGAITTRTLLSMSSASMWRKDNLLLNNKVQLLSDLGEGVLDNAMVDTAAYTIRFSKTDTTSFFLSCRNTNQKLEDIVKGIYSPQNERFVFCIKPSEFLNLPENTIAYWTTKKIRNIFYSVPSVQDNTAEVKTGLNTSDDFRFVRCWWEVPQHLIFNGEHPKTQDWINFNKGGAYSPFYSDLHLVINWRNNGEELKSFPKANIRNEDMYFKEGLSYPIKNRFRFSVKPLPKYSIFSHVGSTIFPFDEFDYYKLVALFHSLPFTYFIKSISSWNFEVGAVQKTPLPNRQSNFDAKLSKKAKEIIELRLELEKNSETSHHFLPYPWKNKTLRIILDSLIQSERLIVSSISDLINQIDELSFKYYDLNKKDMSVIRESLNGIISDDIKPYHQRFINLTKCLTISEFSANSFISILFGCLVGRWDVRNLINDKIQSMRIDPFSTLAACSPGMLTVGQDQLEKHTNSDMSYPLRVSWKGILVDDPTSNEDVEIRLREIIHLIWNTSAGDVETEFYQIFNIGALREYFQKYTLFFDFHYNQYSKSRRFAPIYWPLSTPSGSYSLWLYYHRIDDQILFTCVNDYVDPKLQQIAADIARLRSKRDRTRKEEDQLAELADFELELKDFRQELLRVAAFWKPNLNDGVEITAAPLWRLFQHRVWQKQLKATWKNLEDGEYDWAHLAYSIWPERVKEKCKTDKSLAIAHDLEHFYQGDD